MQVSSSTQRWNYKRNESRNSMKRGIGKTPKTGESATGPSEIQFLPETTGLAEVDVNARTALARHTRRAALLIWKIGKQDELTAS